MEKCLITKLKGGVSNDTLLGFGEIKIRGTWHTGISSMAVYYGPGPSNKLADDVVIVIEKGGTIDGLRSKTIPKGASATPYSYVTITKDNDENELVFTIKNKYTLGGFGFGNAKVDFVGLKMADLKYMISVNRFVFAYYDEIADMVLTSFVEMQLSAGRTTPFAMWCFPNYPYEKYPGDTTYNTASHELQVTFNSDFTEYQLTSDDSTILAKRQLVDGVWTSLPTT